MRQDALRAEKLVREAAAKKVEVAKARNKKVGTIVGAVVALLALIIGLNLFRGSSSTKEPKVDVSVKNAPKIEVPKGVKPPTKLEVKDLRVGTGSTVQKGDTVKVKYSGVAWSTKVQFDSNWSIPENTFDAAGIGTENRGVIEGWDGLVGAKVGGRRQLIIPPDLGYGDNPRPGGKIGKNETLIFVVDIISRTPAASK